MMSKKTELKLLSFNVRGLRCSKKRQAIYRWIKSKNVDIVFLQETHSCMQIENRWDREWDGKAFFSHGTTNAKGVMILIRKNVDFLLEDIKQDTHGRFIYMKCVVNDKCLNLINIYAPNIETEQVIFLQDIDKILNRSQISSFDSIIIGGDWNIVRDNVLDKSRGINDIRNNTRDNIDKLLNKYELNDSWRIKNPTTRRFSWRQKTPLIQCRLDFWLISDMLFDEISEIDIIPSVRSDHSAIILNLNNNFETKKGPGFWKLNCKLLEDDNYIQNLNTKIVAWKQEFQTIENKQVKWDLLKYKIRQFSIKYSKNRCRERRNRETELSKKLMNLERNLNDNNIQEYENVKTELVDIENEKIQGQIVRSRIEWSEKGEKNTKFFFELEKKNSTRRHIKKLHDINGQITQDPKQVIDIQKSYYKALYTSKTSGQIDNSWFNKIKKLTEEEKLSIEGQITEIQCRKVLDSFKKLKTPGNDGLPIEFYLTFWQTIKDVLIESYNESFNKKEMTITQKQAIITLIEKKGKDRSKISNWRPISLLNVDYKIATKVIANRIIPLIPKLINIDQSGFVKGRLISDTIRTVQDIIDYCKMHKKHALLLFIDFEKAYDSIEWDFKIKCLQQMNFGDDIIQWIQAFYQNTSSCILNNGNSSGYFSLSRGLRQGDPLSSYLFVLTVETLSNTIRNNPNIKGLSFGNKEYKLLQYADDTTLILENKAAVQSALTLIQNFSLVSGLKINTDKTEAMWLGPRQPHFTLPDIKWTEDCIKLLGIFVGKDPDRAQELNFKDKMKTLKSQLQNWKRRDLSLTGKVLIIKALAISQFIYLANLIPFPDDRIKEINFELYQFLWNTPIHKVKQNIIIQDYNYGGIRMPDIESIIKSQKFKWVQMYLNNYNCNWRNTMEELIKVENLTMYLRGNSKLNPKQASIFYKEVLNVRIDIINSKLNIEQRKYNKYIFYNKDILVNGKHLYNDELFKAGIWNVRDLFDDHGNVIKFEILLQRGVTNKSFMNWRSLIGIVQSSDIFKRTEMETDYMIVHDILEKEYNLLTMPMKLLTKILTERKYVQSKAARKYIQEFRLSKEELETSYVIPRYCVKNNKLKDLQFKINHQILPSNKLLRQMNKIESNKCTFCGLYEESYKHLFHDCVNVNYLWSNIRDNLDNLWFENINDKMVLLGYDLSNEQDNHVQLNKVILYVKLYIWQCRKQSTLPELAKCNMWIISHI